MGRLRFFVAVLVLLSGAVPSWSRAEGGPPTLTGVRVIKAAEGLAVELTADREMVSTCYKVPQLQKVVIDLPGTEPGRPDTLYKVYSGLIATIKVLKKSVNGVMVTRVAVDLAEDADFQVDTDSPNKKILTVYFRKPASAAPSSLNPAAAPVAAPPETGEAAAAPLKRESAETAAAMEKLPAPVIPAPLATHRPEASPEIVTVSGIDFSRDAIVIMAGRAITDFRYFTLGDPARLVIDIPSATCTVGVISVSDNRFGIIRARTGVSNGKLRLVFEAGKKSLAGLRVEKTERGLKVVQGIRK